MNRPLTIMGPRTAAEQQRGTKSFSEILERSACTVVHGDSRIFITNVPDSWVDFILTDPPYNLNGYSTGNIKLAWRKDINNDVAEWDGEQFNVSV